VRFAKRDDLRWLSHLDLMRALQRAFKRAGIEPSYSRGFHPQPLFSFGPALAVGIESEAELFDFETAKVYDGDDLVRRLNAALPPGLRVLDAWPIAGGGDSLAAQLVVAEYRAWINEARRALLPADFARLDADLFGDPERQRLAIAAVLSRDEIIVVRRSKGIEKSIDIRPFVRSIEWRPQTRAVHMTLGLGPQGQARPQEVLEALYGAPAGCFRLRRMRLSARDGEPIDLRPEAAVR
jgi:radical SAM-linked protein